MEISFTAIITKYSERKVFPMVKMKTLFTLFFN